MAEVEIPNPKELEEIREKAFTKRVALITAVFAVILAIAALGRNYRISTSRVTPSRAAMSSTPIYSVNCFANSQGLAWSMRIPK